MSQIERKKNPIVSATIRMSIDQLLPNLILRCSPDNLKDRARYAACLVSARLQQECLSLSQSALSF